MGLSISGSCVEESWGYSYQILHHIRWLAMKTSGYDKSLEEFLKTISIDRKGKSDEDYEKYPEFYQLLHFTDCDGVLINDSWLEGVDYKKSYTLGSSDKLFEELKIIRKFIGKKKKVSFEIPTYLREAFDELYNLVEGEIEEGRGIITFS